MNACEIGLRERESATPSSAALGALEARQQVGPTPARAAEVPPRVVVERLPADVDHEVDRRGPTEHPPPRQRDRRFSHRGSYPVESPSPCRCAAAPTPRPACGSAHSCPPHPPRSAGPAPPGPRSTGAPARTPPTPPRSRGRTRRPSSRLMSTTGGCVVLVQLRVQLGHKAVAEHLTYEVSEDVAVHQRPGVGKAAQASGRFLMRQLHPQQQAVQVVGDRLLVIPALSDEHRQGRTAGGNRTLVAESMRDLRPVEVARFGGVVVALLVRENAELVVIDADAGLIADPLIDLQRLQVAALAGSQSPRSCASEPSR